MIRLESDASAASTPSLAERMEAMFSPHGRLSRSPDFEYRPQQQRMAVAVAEALGEERGLMVEAGTGVGKSLAYLIPAVLFALENGRKAVVSTHTINLQEQLVDKDIPIVRQLIDPGFETVLLKGRHNYLCPSRLRAAMAQTADLFSSSEEGELRRIERWSHQTEDGSLSDLPFQPAPQVWGQVCSEPHLCTRKRCKHVRCFYQENRRRMESAQVVVMNHTLFFTLLGGVEASEKGVLFGNDLVVFDEAHTLEQVAAGQLGLNLSLRGACYDLHRLFHPGRKKGLFQALRHAAGAGAVTELLEDLRFFFNEIENRCRFRGENRAFRLRRPGIVEDGVGESFARVEEAVRDAADRLDSEDSKLELEELGRRVQDLRIGVRQFLDQTLEGHVYWVEKGGRADEEVRLQTAPVDVAASLRQLIFDVPRPIILTSATLAVGSGGADYFRSRIGADEMAFEQIGSPFDYAEQMRIFVVRSMPGPEVDDYEDHLARWIARLVKRSNGSAFVLFTGYRLMRRTAERMRDYFGEKGWPLLVQGDGRSRRQLIAEFKERPGSVLFGTDSFWAGVDVPGQALSNVIVTKLPFAVPDHPLIASRMELLQERGKSGFYHYAVPEAVLKLRQGVGRLIRTRKDRGIVAILDNRLLTRTYGKVFLQALPDAPVEIV